MKRKPSRPIKRHAVKAARRKRPRRAIAGGDLGENIKRARTAKGMTQLALAHAIGYEGDDAGAAICRIENNTQAPRIDTVMRIAEALGVQLCSLLTK